MLQNILITGGSRGLGFALAAHYAKTCNVFIISKNISSVQSAVQKLQSVARHEVQGFVVDVNNYEDLNRIMHQVHKSYPLNVIYVNAGVSLGTVGKNDGVVATNVNGALNTFDIGANLLKAKGGSLVVISSVASFFAFSNASAYCASKAFIRIYALSLVEKLKKQKIYVSVICPGFIKTDMTNVNNFRMPFIMSSQKAAVKITKIVQKGKKIAIFPIPLKIIVKLKIILSAMWT